MIQPVPISGQLTSQLYRLAGILCCWLLLQPVWLRAGNGQIRQLTMLDARELDKVWATFPADASGSGLTAGIQRKGFSRQSGAEAAWGFRGVDGQGIPLFMGVWLFEPMTEKGSASAAIIWIQQNRRQYKAFLTFPENMAGLQQAQEWVINNRGELAQATGWHMCFKNRLTAGSCETTCETRTANTFCYPNAFFEFYTFQGKSRMFNLRAYLDCMVARCGDQAACMLMLALDCGVTS